MLTSPLLLLRDTRSQDGTWGMQQAAPSAFCISKHFKARPAEAMVVQLWVQIPVSAVGGEHRKGRR